MMWSLPGADELLVDFNALRILAEETAGDGRSVLAGRLRMKCQLIVPEAAELLKCQCMCCKRVSGSLMGSSFWSLMLGKAGGHRGPIHLMPSHGRLVEVMF